VYEACRRMGHAWDQLDTAPLGHEGLQRDVYLRCIRCATLRAFDLSPTGEVMWARYVYPDGYQWKGRTGEAPTKADHRIAWLRDIIASRKQRS